MVCIGVDWFNVLINRSCFYMDGNTMIIFDLDGTLRDSSCGDHLVPEDVTKAVNWIPWQSYVNVHGIPVKAVCDIYRENVKNEDVVILTSSQFGTADWLIEHGLPIPTDIVERDAYDNRSPLEYKSCSIDLLKDEITLWVDDDEQELKYARESGLNVLDVNQLTESKWDVVQDKDIKFPQPTFVL